SMSLRFMVFLPWFVRAIVMSLIAAESSNRVRLACTGKFLRQRISQHGDLVPDTDASKAAADGEPRRFAARHEQPQRLAGRCRRTAQSSFRRQKTWIVEALRTAETIGKIVMAKPTEIEAGRRQDLLCIFRAVRRFDQRDGENRF